MPSYLNKVSTRRTPQSEPILGRHDQHKNAAGGYVFDVGDWGRLERFLILGSAGGTYYVGEQKLTRENAELIFALARTDGIRLIRTIVEISTSGRAPKNDPALFALAVASAAEDPVTRGYALDKLPRVARTATHLFQFLTFVQQFRGWGRGLRNAVDSWYERPDLAYQLVKYRQRDGWTHRDVLRKAHPRAAGFKANADLRWAAGQPIRGELDKPSALIAGFERLQAATSTREVVEVLNQFRDLPREAIPTQFLNEPMVWGQLLHNGMPQTALMRNLGNMTRVGALGPFDWNTKLVASQLADEKRIKGARLHPLNILIALRTYASGRGLRGTNSWTPIPAIIDALDAAFYLSFKTLEPTGKRHLLGLDISSSMTWGQVAGTPLTPREATAAMAMATAAVEPHMMVGFSHELVPLNLSPRQRLDDVVRTLDNLPFGGTDASLPILYAIRQSLEVDAFVTYTDNETWRGRIHPVQALEQYRRQSGIDAKLIVVAMTATRSTIGDPTDPNTLDVVGFDSATPAVLADFVR